jgi:hypothetical protein
MADDYGYTDEFGQEIIPPGTRINGVPTATAAPTPGSGDWTTLSRGGPVAIRTPNSSTGQPAFQAPSASQFQPPATQTRPSLLTPKSTTGAPGYQVPTVNPMTLPGVGGGLMTGVGALNAFPTPTPEQMNQRLNNPPLADDPWLIHSIGKLFGYDGGQTQAAPAPATQTQPQTAPAPPSGAPTATATATPPPTPLGYPPLPPPRPPNLPPFIRGPIPYSGGNAPPAPQHVNLGYGVPGAPPLPPFDPGAIHPSNAFTTIDRPNADISGGPTRGGWLSASYDPSTGTNRGAREPGGPARMGALDLSGLFNRGGAQAPPPAGALAAPQPGGGWGAAAGTPNMNNAMLGMQLQNAGISTGGRGARAQAPAGFSNKKFFGNPANWQYPNVPF